MSETPEQDYEHSLVWVTSPDTTQARQYCRECGHRTEWQELPPELAPHGDLLEDDLRNSPDWYPGHNPESEG